MRSKLCVGDGGVNILLVTVLGWVVLGGGCGGVLPGRAEVVLMEREMKKLLPGSRMDALSDPLWFVAPDRLKVVNMEVTAVGCFVLIVS